MDVFLHSKCAVCLLIDANHKTDLVFLCMIVFSSSLSCFCFLSVAFSHLVSRIDIALNADCIVFLCLSSPPADPAGRGPGCVLLLSGSWLHPLLPQKEEGNARR